MQTPLALMGISFYIPEDWKAQALLYCAAGSWRSLGPLHHLDTLCV